MVYRQYRTASDGAGERGQIGWKDSRAWTNLPGPLLSYLRLATELRQTDTTNAEVYEQLCRLWKVPMAFGAYPTQTRRTVYIIVDSGGEESSQSERAAVRRGEPIWRKNLIREYVDVIEFLARNSGATTKRLEINCLSELRQASADDWVVFPSPILSQFLFGAMGSSPHRWLARLPQSTGPSSCQVAVFGVPQLNHDRALNPLEMKFAQVWNHGAFLTFTTQAVTSSAESLARLLSLLEAHQDHYAENPRKRIHLQIWVSLFTYWSLNPNWHGPTGRRHPTPTTASIRAFNMLHNPELPIPIISEEISARQNISLNDHRVLAPFEIPHVEVVGLVRRMDQLERFEGEEEHSKEELSRIEAIERTLLLRLWKFGTCIVVVSEYEMRRLKQSNLSQTGCFVTFEQLFRLLEHDLLMT